MGIDPELIPKIKMVAPGTLLRRALDDIIMAEFGALIVFLDDIKETEVEGEGKYYYFWDIDEYAEESVLYASFNKNWLIERLIVDYFINLVTDN